MSAPTSLGQMMAKIINETVFKIINRHLLPRFRPASNDNERPA